uniref:Neurotransmitter-gated ion-channel ligand-binding domain-containing protein n=1 Tax=Romanomermis culicivorax TaxID=13658 RepID=A0A915IDU7_ROMCU
NLLTPHLLVKSGKDAVNFRFPFDEQTCSLKFGSWSHTEESLNLLHMDGNRAEFALEYQPDTGTLVNIS